MHQTYAAARSSWPEAAGCGTAERTGVAAGTGRAVDGTGGRPFAAGLLGMEGFGLGAGGGPFWPMAELGREGAGEDSDETGGRGAAGGGGRRATGGGGGGAVSTSLR